MSRYHGLAWTHTDSLVTDSVPGVVSTGSAVSWPEFSLRWRGARFHDGCRKHVDLLFACRGGQSKHPRSLVGIFPDSIWTGITQFPAELPSQSKHASKAEYIFCTTKGPILSPMYKLEIFCGDEQRVTSLTFDRLFAKKKATRRKQGGDACSDLDRLNVRSKNNCAEK